MRITCITTQSDWANLFGNWGYPGVKFILDRCAKAGMNKVYWRVTDGGRMMYLSKLGEVEYRIDDNEGARHFYGGTNYESVDYREWDPLAEAVEYAHKIGIELHAWIQVCEEDHPWGLLSRYAQEHPEFLSRDRDGHVLRAHLSFAYPEVVEYKLALVREVLAYGVDGFLVDFHRFCGNTHPLLDERGVALYGYDKPAIRTFLDQYGEHPGDLKNGDARWVALRAAYVTDFIRALGSTLREAKKPFGAYAPWKGVIRTWWDPDNDFQGTRQKSRDHLASWLYDLKTWTQEHLVDYVCPDIWVPHGGGWGPPGPGLIQRIAKYYRETIALPDDVGLYLSYYAWGVKPAKLRQGVEAAVEAGFDELVLCESQGIERTTNYWVKPWETVGELNRTLQGK